MNRFATVIWLMVVGLLSGCAASQTTASSAPDAPAQPSAAGKPLAYVSGQPLTEGDLLEPLLEDSGGEVLSEIVLDRAIDQKLAARGLKLTPAQIAKEKQLVLATLSPDPNEAARLLKRLRQRRGLGKVRFAAMLRRNAGLRLLVKSHITVTPAALHRAYQRTYGPQYQAQLIVRPTADQIQQLRSKIQHGASFTRLAIEDSTDPSSIQGGLLPPISPADPAYPQAIRSALTKLKPGQISPIIGIEGGFALLKLVRKIQGKSVKFDDVKKALIKKVRTRAERLQMRQLAQRLLKQADVVVLDPALSKGWSMRKRLLLPPSP